MESRKHAHDPSASRMAGALRIAGARQENPPSRQIQMIGLPGGESLGAVFESSGEALLVLDAAGIIHHANPRARELLRINPARMLGEPLSDYLAPHSTDDLAAGCRLASDALPAGSLERKSFDGFLSNGFPVRITFRAS